MTAGDATTTTAAATATEVFAGFRPIAATAGGVRFAGVTGGRGPALLLLHGYPQTHLAWRRIAPRLAGGYSLVIPDLPGYGASRLAQTSPRWGKRRVAAALVALMRQLGHDRFAIVGHDRGARAGYRLALDHPAAVTAFASLAVVPTLEAMARIDHRAAAKAFHWFFLAQAAPLPERLLDSDPDLFIDTALAKMAGGLERVEPAALAAYRTAFRDPAVRHAICEDYRAALEEDLAQDQADRAAGRRLACPVHVLWPAASWPGAEPIALWQPWAETVTGGPTPGGHLLPEDAPEEVLASLLPFLQAHHPGTATG